MENYVASRPDIFALGRDGSLRSNRFFAQMVGHHADMFIGATLQIDSQAHSSTFTADRLVGYGGAPNLGSENRSRRHRSEAFLKAGAEAHAGEPMPQGRKLVVQIVETFQSAGTPTFVERLDAWEAMDKAGFSTPPVMIYGSDVSHIVTEEGVANLLLCRNSEEREQAVRGVAGFTQVGLKRDRRMVENLRDRGAIQRAEDLGIQKSDASRDRLAAPIAPGRTVGWSLGERSRRFPGNCFDVAVLVQFGLVVGGDVARQPAGRRHHVGFGGRAHGHELL